VKRFGVVGLDCDTRMEKRMNGLSFKEVMKKEGGSCAGRRTTGEWRTRDEEVDRPTKTKTAGDVDEFSTMKDAESYEGDIAPIRKSRRGEGTPKGIAFPIVRRFYLV